MGTIGICRVAFLLLAVSASVFGIKSYQNRLPHGGNVPHPCKQGSLWDGLGHMADSGGGPLNPFGEDFRKSGWTWTKELCMMDSDGDGLTNGQELGDPECVWKPGATPSRVVDISHPGVCDPWSSTLCFKKVLENDPSRRTQGEWLEANCLNSNTFNCPVVNETGVKQWDLRLTEHPVPAEETTYVCQIIPVIEGDFHIIATEPHIINNNVNHHILLFGCNAMVTEATPPFMCGMAATPACLDYISGWTLGLSGHCMHPDAGFSIGGASGYKFLAMQIHWFNPEHRDDYTDSSGLIIHYTPHKRKYEAGLFFTGPSAFFLPPNKTNVLVESRCTDVCTKNGFGGPLQITTAINHMHYLGVRMSIEILRNNTHYRYLTKEDAFSYDNPVWKTIDPPIEVLPGDEIVTRCTFRTDANNITVSFGEATTDEMCFGLITYYPKASYYSRSPYYCVDKLGVIGCDVRTYSDCPYIWDFMRSDKIAKMPLFMSLEKKCARFAPCREECLEFLIREYQTNGCLQGKNLELIQSSLIRERGALEAGEKFSAYLASCDADVKRIMGAGNGSSSTIAGFSTTAAILTVIVSTLLRKLDAL